MPIYAYRCDCGKTADVLVRGAEPTTADDVAELAGHVCDTPQKLTKLLSAPYIGRSSGGGSVSAPASSEATCGSCGMAPGSCGMDN